MLTTSARENYLSTEVMTATPQKLQLMLIEAAIRSTQLGRQKLQEEKDDEAVEALIHAQQVVGELLAGLNQEVDSELVKKVAAVYLFVFRTLMEANYEQDEKKLNEVLKVLNVERETWQQVCKQLGSDKTTGHETPAIPITSTDDLVSDTPNAGFSLEA